MNADTILVDVREDIRNGSEPFSKIMKAVNGLSTGQQLMLLAPFEPVPLFEVLAKQGFQHSAQRQESGDWEVRFVRGAHNQASSSHEMCSNHIPEKATSLASEVVDVDARGLEPPLPLIKILESLGSLPSTSELRARTDRRPIHLYAQLEERGFGARTEEQSDGSFLTYIFRR